MGPWICHIPYAVAIRKIHKSRKQMHIAPRVNPEQHEEEAEHLVLLIENGVTIDAVIS